MSKKAGSALSKALNVEGWKETAVKCSILEETALVQRSNQSQRNITISSNPSHGYNVVTFAENRGITSFKIVHIRKLIESLP